MIQGIGLYMLLALIHLTYYKIKRLSAIAKHQLYSLLKTKHPNSIVYLYNNIYYKILAYLFVYFVIFRDHLQFEKNGFLYNLM